MGNIEWGSEVIVKTNSKYVTGIVISLEDGNCCVRTSNDGTIFATVESVSLFSA